LHRLLLAGLPALQLPTRIFSGSRSGAAVDFGVALATECDL
jgi:hypothetical protein